jgi:hypothetical protein
LTRLPGGGGEYSDNAVLSPIRKSPFNPNLKIISKMIPSKSFELLLKKPYNVKNE